MNETVTRAVFEAEERGVAATAGALNQLTGAASGSAKAVDAFGKTSQTVAQEIRGIEQRTDALQKRLAGAPAAWARYEAAMRTANQAQEAGTLTGEKYAATVRQIQNELQKVVAPRLDMDAANTGLSALLGNSQKVSAAQREMAKEQLATAQARKIADAEAARGQALLMEQAQRLRMEIDPLAAAQTRLNTELAEYQALAARGMITTEELGRATAVANDRFEDMGRRLGAAGTQARLTQNQMLNLSRQANDSLTMAAMGMSPFMILASQGGQIFGALEENSRGVRGSLEAIGSSIAGFARAIPPAALAVAGLSAAVGGLYLLTRGPSARSAEASVKSFEDAVASLEAAWKGAGEAAEMHYQTARRSGDAAAAALLNVGGNIRELQADLQATVRDLNTSDMLSAPIIWQSSSAQSAARREITALYAEARVGRISVSELADEMLRIRLDPNIDSHARAFADEIRRALGPAEELERRIQSLNVTAAQMSAPSGTTGRYALPAEVADAMFGSPGSNGRFGDGLADMRSGLEAQSLEMTKAGEAARQYADGVASMRTSLQDTVDGLQMQIDYFGQSEGALAAATFRTNALAEAQRAATEAGVDQVAPDLIAFIEQQAAQVGALTDRVNGLREAEQERAKAQQEIEAQAKRVADAYAEIQFRGSIFGMSETDREIATTLNGLKVSYESFDGQRIAGQIRYNASLEETQEQLEKQRQLVENVASTFLDIFTDSSSDSFFDRILKGLGDISRQFADLGKQRLLDMLSGGSVGYTSGFPATGQRTVAPIGVPLAANQNSPAGISVGAVTALNDNLRQSSRSALDVAKQFDGLNERADSRVLDSFMQASGTWRNLSARDTAWCAAFANAALVESGQRGTGSNLASSFMNWGTGTNAPKPGDIVVLRPQARGASGHVGFFDGFDDRGNVRVFGGNQSNAANTRTFGAGEVRSFRTAIAGGVIDANRALATGQAGAVSSGSPVADPWAGMRTVTPGANPMGAGLFGQGGRAQGFMQSPLGMSGMNALSAFGAGMSSGSPVSGGFSGALGAFGMGLPVAGIALGAIGGILGGIFGRSKQKRAERRQREEQERQQRLQAQQQLDQQLPAILELQDTLLDRASGTLTKERARIESQLKQYQTLAATAKNQAEIDRLTSMQANLDDYMERLYDQLRLTAGSVIQSMLAGRGLEPEFAKAVSGVREQSLAIRNYIADLTAATGASSAEVQGAIAAGREQLLRMLSGAEEVTEIWTKLDSLTGTASQLSTELQKLGANAEEAAVAIADHLGRGIQKMRDEFVRGIADETAEGMGLGYLPQIRALLERRETMRADATSLGADPALIDRWFGVQARNILDQAGLLDKEIAPLVEAFPELANVLGDSSAKIERSLADAENDLRTAYQRVRQFADQLAAFRDDIKLDRNLSTLGPEERLLEAQRQFRDQAAKAAAGDAEAQGELINLSRSYLDEAKGFYTTSEAYYAIFREVDDTLKATEAKALQEINLAAAQHGALLTLNESVLTIPQALAAMDAAQAARDAAQGLALQAYVQALNPQAAVPSYQAPQPVAPIAPPPVAAGPSGPTYEYHNGLAGKWTDMWGQRVFVRAGEDPDLAWTRHLAEVDAARNGGAGSIYDQKRFGGVIGAYQGGGVVGNGIWDRDSVLARFAGGGFIALAGGEGVLTAPAMRQPGVRPFMEAANAGRLPEMRMPRIAMPSAPSIRGQDNRELVAAVGRLESGLVQVRQAIGLGAVGTIDAVDRGTRVNQEQAAEARRRRAAP